MDLLMRSKGNLSNSDILAAVKQFEVLDGGSTTSARGTRRFAIN